MLFSAHPQPVAAEAPKASDSTSHTVVLFQVADKTGRNNADLDKALRKAAAEAVPAKLQDTHRRKLADAQASAQCRDRSVDCLRAISQQLGASILLAPTLDRGPDDLVLSILMFDGRNEGSVNEMAHWQDGTKLSAETLQALPQLVRGLFLPKPVMPPEAMEPAVADASSTAAPPTAAAASSDSGRDWAPLIPPLSVIGGGVVLLGAGIVSGLMMRGTEDDYQGLEVSTRADAEKAAALRDTAETEATVSKVCFAISSLAIAAGGAWLSYELFGRSKAERQVTRVAPLITPQQVGLVVRYQGGSL